MNYDRTSRCPCKNGPVCHDCHYCLGCSCRCHTWFTLRSRLFEKKAEVDVLERVKKIAAKSTEEDLYLDDDRFMSERMEAARKLWGYDEVVA